MIAAHAMSLDLPLVSRDRVFQQIGGLRLENWME
jgi:predicted nucleic acid-binding protein